MLKFIMEDLRDNFNKKELQELCRKLDLPVTGLKDQIIKRIVNHLVPVEPSKTDSFSQTDILPSTSTRFSFFKALIKRRRTSMPNLLVHEDVPPLRSVSSFLPSQSAMTLPNLQLKVIKFIENISTFIV